MVILITGTSFRFVLETARMFAVENFTEALRLALFLSNTSDTLIEGYET